MNSQETDWLAVQPCSQLREEGDGDVDNMSYSKETGVEMIHAHIWGSVTLTNCFFILILLRYTQEVAKAKMRIRMHVKQV